MKYLISSAVTAVRGTQYWVVQAESEQEALDIFNFGGGDFLEQEIEVLDTDETSVEIYEIEDCAHDPAQEEEKWADANTQAVANMMKQRMEVGLRKYGVTTERKDIDLLGWLQHLQEELCDAAVYVERIKRELSGK